MLVCLLKVLEGVGSYEPFLGYLNAVASECDVGFTPDSASKFYIGFKSTP